MALTYHPTPGEIVLCDYGTGFVAPEMVKRRPVVIISPRLRRRGDLVSVVPLSTTEPAPVENHHCRLALAVALPRPFHNKVMWAKCDMLATVSLGRLDRFRAGRGAGARKFVTGSLTADQLREVRRGVLHALGLASLTVHL